MLLVTWVKDTFLPMRGSLSFSAPVLRRDERRLLFPPSDAMPFFPIAGGLTLGAVDSFNLLGGVSITSLSLGPHAKGCVSSSSSFSAAVSSRSASAEAWPKGSISFSVKHTLAGSLSKNDMLEPLSKLLEEDKLAIIVAQVNNQPSCVIPVDKPTTISA